MSSLLVAAVGFVAFGVFIALAYRKQWQWTGLPAPREEDNGASGQSAKTLWDWLQLLGIPVALAALAFLLNDAQTRRDERRDDQRAAQQQRRGEDTERENTLRAYLTQMSGLMLNDDLLQSKPGADVRNVARTVTLTAVRRLDGPRKGLVVRFLFEAGLLGPKVSRDTGVTERFFGNRAAVVVLRNANLRGADLGGANLFVANLRGTNLVEADLGGANLGGANLIEANLIGANLVEANLGGANLRGADLGSANLGSANLRGANLDSANLRGADLRGALHVELANTRGTPAHRP